MFPKYASYEINTLKIYVTPIHHPETKNQNFKKASI